MANYKVKSYSSYASSMAKPSSSGMSSRLDDKGYTPKSTASSSSLFDKKGYTPTKSTSTAAARAYNDKYVAPGMSNKSEKPRATSGGLGAKTTIKPTPDKPANTEDRFAFAWTNSGGSNYDPAETPKPNPLGLYEKPDMQVVQKYLTGTAITDALYEAQGLINQSTTPQMQMSTRPMTAEEIKKFAPVKELTEKGITVEQLSAMDAPMQKATLENLGITNAQWVSYQGPRPMSLQEFDKTTMDSVHYGQPLIRDPKNAMYNTIQQPTQQGLGYNQADIIPAQPSAEQTTILPNSQAMMAAPTLGEEPNLDTLSNQMLEKPVAAAPSAGLMSRRLDEKGKTPVNDSVLGVALSKNKTNDTLSKASIETQIKDIVGKNIKAAGILGAFTKESGPNFDDLEEGNSYSLTAAYGSWSDPDVDDVLAKLPKDVQTRLKADYEAGIRTGGSASAADRQLLGNAMFDTKYSGGSNYRGRGLIHITHDYNYKAVGDKIGVDLVSNPELVNDPRYAVPAAIAYLDINGYFDEDKAVTKDTLHNMVNRYSSNAVKNARWKAAQKYLKDWEGKPLEESLRPKQRPE